MMRVVKYIYLVGEDVGGRFERLHHGRGACVGLVSQFSHQVFVCVAGVLEAHVLHLVHLKGEPVSVGVRVYT